MIRDHKKLISLVVSGVLITANVFAAAFQYGGLRLDSVVVTAGGTTTQLTNTDKQIRIVTGAAPDTQKLPDATTLSSGYWYRFINGGTGVVTVANSSGLTLAQLWGGQSTDLVLSSSSTTGGPWLVTSGATTLTNWQTYTVSISGSSSNPSKGTTSIDQGYWRREGDSMRIRYEYKQTAAGSAGSGTYYFSIPSGYTIDTTKLANPNGTSNNLAQSLGVGVCSDANTQIWAGSVQVSDTTHLYINIASPSAASNAVGSAACTLSSTVMRYGFEALVPISGWNAGQ